MDISEPSVLTRLTGAVNKATWFGPVYSLSTGLKRKRQELCTAVDGDSISILEVVNGRSLSSCLLPPESKLLCAPCAIRQKTTNGKDCRIIYYASKRRNEFCISVFNDQLQTDNAKFASSTIVLENQRVPVAQLEIISGLDTFEVLAIRNNGTFEVYNQDITSRTQHGKLQGLSAGARILTVKHLTSSQAHKSVLQSRPDLLLASEPGASFIVGVFSVTDELNDNITPSVEFGLWKLHNRQSGQLNKSVADRLLHFDLSISSPLVPQEREPILFAMNDTRLIVKTQPKVYAFDLTLSKPKMTQELSPVAPDHLSSIYITDALTLSSTSTALQLHNTQFKTLQAKLDLEKSGLKRKRGHSSRGPILFVTYFPKLSRIIATRRDQLIAFDLQVRGSNNISAAAHQTSLLINNLGHGTMSQERLKASDRNNESLVGRLSKQNEAIERWNGTSTTLEECIQKQSFNEFQRICFEHILSKGNQASSESPIVINHKIDYLISKLFRIEPHSTDTMKTTVGQLKLALPLPNLLASLAAEGWLTNQRLEKVLKVTARSSFVPLEDGSITQILIDSDPALNSLHSFLDRCPHITYRELCIVVVRLLRLALAESNTLQTALEDTKLGNHNIKSVLIPTKPEDSPSINITRCLCIALEKLAETGSQTSSGIVRELLTQTDIITLVQFLRQRLFYSGYTRSLQSQQNLSVPNTEDEASTSEQHTGLKGELSLGAIATLLSSCINAIGPVGVLRPREEEQFLQVLVSELSTEVSRATEALQEAAYLEGILRETLRFAESKVRSGTQGSIDDDEKSKDHILRSGTITTIFAEATTDANSNHELGLLPLGLRAEGKINTRKVRKGNGRLTKRSQREMGMQQDRLRGPYALERLVL